MKAVPEMTPEQIDRFWAKVNIGGPDECWEWTAGVTRNGYGQFNLKPRLFYARRIAFLLGQQKQPTGLLVCHKCDNRLCCNPSHLFLGTHSDNMSDCASKGRLNTTDRHGELHSRARLSEKDIHEIRKSDESQACLSARYGVCQAHISRIQLRKSWKHI